MMGSLAWLLKKAQSSGCVQILINSNVLVQLSRVRFQRSAYDRVVQWYIDLQVSRKGGLLVIKWANDRVYTVYILYTRSYYLVN